MPECRRGTRSFARSLLVCSLALMGVGFAAPPADAQLERLIMSPKKVIDTAIEARSTEDLAKDNEIVVKFNGAMADIGSLNATSTIYEQVLTVTGLFDNKANYDKLKKATQQIPGVKKLHWHAVYISAEEKKTRKDVASWDNVLAMQKKAEARMISAEGVSDVNFRVCVDALGTVYVMGRARSKGELDKAIATARNGDGIKKAVNYAVVRP